MRKPFRTARTVRIAFYLVVVASLLRQFRWFLSTPSSTAQVQRYGDAATDLELALANRTSASTTKTASQTEATIPYYNNRRSLEWQNGCLSSASIAMQTRTPEGFDATAPANRPKGIVVTIALAPKNRQHLSQGRDQLCNNLPNQWEWFLHPQGMDMLLVIQDEDRRWNTKRFAKCLNLLNNHTTSGNGGNTKSWYNLDGTKLITTEYSYNNTLAGTTSSVKIFLATTIVRYPRYIRNNMTRLEDRKNGPPQCSARLRYLQGCRWYTQEMLHLSILQQYDYFLKMDTDIMFRKSPTFHLLQDMQNKGAVFAHAAEYHPRGDASCAPGIVTAMKEFIQEVNANTTSNKMQTYSWSNPHINTDNRFPITFPNLPLQWKKQVCSSASPEIRRDADQYYCNFLIGKVEYFTSPWLLEFATFLSEYPNGFFKNKWGDQIFWHFAMGLLLEKVFTNYVVDYTDLRCKPNSMCWYSVFDTEQYGPNAAELCSGDLGIFVHSKSLDFVQRVKAENYSFVPSLPNATAAEALFESTYQQHCPT